MKRTKQQKFRQLRPYILFGVTLTGILILIVSTVGRQEFNTPQKLTLDLVGRGQLVLKTISNVFTGTWGKYVALWDVREENENLRKELDKHKSVTSEYREAMATNVRLSKLLRLKDSLPPPTITAQIIGRDPSLWFRTVIIDQGRKDGVEKGMPVITAEGIVGQVLDTSPGFSKVLLANDPNSAIDVIIQKNRAQGIIKGVGDAYDLHYILKNADVEKGDLVVTSGMGGIFPKGLPVGTVSWVMKSKRGMFQQIKIAPAVDFSKLEYLIVALKEKSLAEDTFDVFDKNTPTPR
ncbi:MAG: rod shape-determining protein MreC [Desulfobulbaceae bacterium]|uniref:Cell shape-determining protein MreC n=1 Tax=Candidatus Desulfobia pelagia TaxID=2841692 RepID=A0A8J6NDX7_9BACT|nr:rod shape-determining protein MreC [Candidatus Desulfobia pelagia]